MGLSEWPRQTDLIFGIHGPGRLENARLLNFNWSLTLPMKMQIGEALSRVGSWPGPRHQCWGADLNDVPEPLHPCVVLFSLTAPCPSLSLMLIGQKDMPMLLSGGTWEGGGEAPGRRLAAGLVKGWSCQQSPLGRRTGSEVCFACAH